VGALHQLSSNDIKSFRTQLGLKQDEFAALTGISRATISNYESGRGIPTIKACKRLFEAAKNHNYDLKPKCGNGVDYKSSMMDILKNINDSKMALARAENQIFNLTSGD